MNIKGLFAGVILSLGTAVAANAATLGYTATDPWVSGSGSFEFGDDGTIGDLLAFGMDVTSASTMLPNPTTLDFSMDYTVGAPDDGSATGLFFLEDGDSFVLSDSIIGVGFIENIIEIAFNSITADFMGTDMSPTTSTVALLTIDFGAGFGANPFATLGTSTERLLDATFKLSAVEVSAVPVPASLPLLLVGLGAIGYVRRRQNA